MDHISSILDIDYNTLQVTVEAGIRLRSLSQQLWQAGLSLVNHGVVSEQSLAGALMVLIIHIIHLLYASNTRVMYHRLVLMVQALRSYQCHHRSWRWIYY